MNRAQRRARMRACRTEAARHARMLRGKAQLKRMLRKIRLNSIYGKGDALRTPVFYSVLS